MRGLGPQFNVVTLNGCTLATENVGREFSFDVLPSELISGANVYKSPQANLNGASTRRDRGHQDRQAAGWRPVRGRRSGCARSITISPTTSGPSASGR